MPDEKVARGRAKRGIVRFLAHLTSQGAARADFKRQDESSGKKVASRKSDSTKNEALASFFVAEDQNPANCYTFVADFFLNITFETKKL